MKYTMKYTTMNDIIENKKYEIYFMKVNIIVEISSEEKYYYHAMTFYSFFE